MTTQSALGSDRSELQEPTSFEYQRADSWAEAVELLGIWHGEAKIIAGGQSLVPMINLRLAIPGALIDINEIGDEGGPRLEQSANGPVLVIPALTRHATILSSPMVAEHCPVLQQAVRFVGNVRIRNRGTFGGSMAHADPTGEIPCSVLALGGSIRLQGPGGTRDVPASEFFRTYLTTAAAPDEVVTEVRIPSAAGSPWAFDEVTRRFSDFATVSVVLQVRAGTASLVLGGVADHPVLIPADLLPPGDNLDEVTAHEVARRISESLHPESDVHATADYRRRLAQVLVRRALLAAHAPHDWNGEGA